MRSLKKCKLGYQQVSIPCKKIGNPEVLTHRDIYIYYYTVCIYCVYLYKVCLTDRFDCVLKNQTTYLSEKKFLMMLSSGHWPDPHLRTRNFTHLRTLTHLRTQWAKCHSLAHPHHLSFWKKPLHFHHCWLWGAVGWGGTIMLMFLCTHRHRNLIIFPALVQTQALLFHDQLPVGWGGVGP